MKKGIGIIGFGGNDEKLNMLAYETGIHIAEYGLILFCGGLGGIMEAACRGASEKGGITVGILPGGSHFDANKYIDIPVVTNMGEARNVILVRSSTVLIAIGGGFGTLSEISFGLKLEVPVIGLRTWDISEKIIKASNPSDAVDIAYNIISKIEATPQF